MKIAVGCLTHEDFLYYVRKEKAKKDAPYIEYIFVNHPVDCYDTKFDGAVILPSFTSIHEAYIVYDVIVRHLLKGDESLIDDQRPYGNTLPPPPKDYQPTTPEVKVIKQEEPPLPVLVNAGFIKKHIALLVSSNEQYERFKTIYSNCETMRLLSKKDLDEVKTEKLDEVIVCGTYWLNANLTWFLNSLRALKKPVYTINRMLMVLNK